MKFVGTVVPDGPRASKIKNMYSFRKNIRLEGYDYNSVGLYFITVCTVEKKKLLCKIKEPTVGTVVLDGPLVQLTDYGEIVEHRLRVMSDFYDDIKLDSFVVMPNHIHMMVRVLKNGPSGTTVPTMNKVGRFVGTFKRLTNREIGINIWQSRSHDRIVRSDEEYFGYMEYIEANPQKWMTDDHYVAD